MEKYRYLLKNIGVLTLSNFATKILSFFLIPLYTSILTTAEYGTYDFLNAFIGVLLPILTLNIQESVLRFSMDDEVEKKAIVSVSVRYLVISNILVAILLVINWIFGVNKTLADYSVLFFLMFLLQSLSGILIYYIRGIGKITELSISSVITSFVIIVCNLIFLLVLKWGLIGYFIANLIGPLVQCVYLARKSNVFATFRFNGVYEAERKAMIEYSKPLIANSVAWWVNNVSDRFVIVLFRGLSENGVYSVAGKIPSILLVFQTIFNQSWTLSAVKDFDPEDKNGFFANTYKIYNCMMVIICSGIIVADKILANILYSKDFYIAWKYVPWLTTAIVFGAISGYLGGFFSAVKDSKKFATSTIIGAITNIVLNMILTPVIGAMGAAIATTVCYVVTWAYRYYQAKKIIKFKVRIKRDIISYVVLVVQSIVLLMLTGVNLYFVEVGLFLCILILYFGDIKIFLNKILQKRRIKIV